MTGDSDEVTMFRIYNRLNRTVQLLAWKFKSPQVQKEADFWGELASSTIAKVNAK